ncbi:NapC/NirT family cytochrome c [Anaerolineales bacterium HSG6]|nr:NapC/NirT family cytochrome c [Anaerolineales bacterium HSG6]MDM8531985.1 NapC/NirT family cytochrome c [Anaerolineales bacterium HSG25]
MFKTILNLINRVITPRRTRPLWIRLLPYAFLIAVGLLIFALTGATWEYTNSSQFCGTQCHTMPPEYAAYQFSPHARVNCVECHIGRAFIATQFTRKAGDLSHVISYLGAEYEVPLHIKHLRPANQICERCHNPEKFSDNSLKKFERFSAERNNEPSITYLTFKTGGGMAEEGLGKGIHWHINNTVEYIATDESYLAQEIPWVRLTRPDGSTEVYVDIEADLPSDFAMKNEEHLHIMDCTSCHNRIAHQFRRPSDTIDEAMSRGLISPEIPYFKQNALAVMERKYPSMEEANKAIRRLRQYYQVHWPDYYAQHPEIVNNGIETLLGIYENTVFPTMDVSWNTHPNNQGHTATAGCFRCHDGKHLNEQQETIRLECNLCHSVPLKNQVDGTSPVLPVSAQFEPESHADSNWVSQHRFQFNDTCEGCHTVENPGGSDDISYCANSGCHAMEGDYTGLNSAELIKRTNILSADSPTHPEVALTWSALIKPILVERCVVCHNPDNPNADIDLTSYEGVLTTVTKEDATNSPLIQVQLDKHPNRLPADSLTWFTEWIEAGMPK